MEIPFSPLLGAIALIPLDKAMERDKGIFYACYIDDWVVMTKTNTALQAFFHCGCLAPGDKVWVSIIMINLY